MSSCGLAVKESITERLGPLAGRHTVRRVQVGLIYSAVELDSGAVGVAYTFPESRQCPSGNAGERGPLAGRKASLLLGGLGSEDLLASTLALATANALLAGAHPPPMAQEGDVLESIEIRDGDRICMVGCFIPTLSTLQTRQISVTVLD